MKGILGKKVGMTTIFKEGKAIPVTIIQAGPVFVVQKRTKEKDGYNRVLKASLEALIAINIR